MRLPRITLATCALLALQCGLAAAEDAAPPKPIEPGPWVVSTTLSLNLSQSAFSDNWAGGDKGNMVWVAGADVKAQRQFSKSFNLSNTMLLAYGQTIQQQASASDPSKLEWTMPKKSTDQILFESVGRLTLDGFVDPYVSLHLDSQFKDDSDPAGALSFNPVRLTESAGFARVLEKTDKIETITRVGFGFRENIGRSIVDATTKATASFSTSDGGIEWTTTANRPLLDGRVLYKGRLFVFKPLFFSKRDALAQFDALALADDPARRPVADDWKAVSLNFQNQFTAQITKILAVNLSLQWVYLKFDPATNVDLTLPKATLVSTVDRGVRTAVQYRETLALGVTYNLF